MSHDNYSEIRFLVIDDMAAIRKMIVQQLKALGAVHLTEAQDGLQAKEQLKEAFLNRIPTQFIICDWNMPRMTGIELLRFCRTDPNYKNVAFLLVTSESDMSQVTDAIIGGVDNYVVKPFSPAAFASKIASVYSKRFPNR